MSLWCLTGPGHGVFPVGRVLAMAVLVVTASGLAPRWTCVPHWYVTFSLSIGMTLADGGEEAAQIATLLLIPLCVGDERLWQWSAPTRAVTPRWRGAGYAAMLAIRLQILVIYAEAAGSKLMSPSWRSGRAVGVLLRDPSFGVPPTIFRALSPVLGTVLASDVLTWSAMAIEGFIAISMLCRWRVRRVAFAGATLLHLGIMITIGLPSFAIVMISVVALSCAGSHLRTSQAPRGVRSDVCPFEPERIASS